MSYCSKSIRLTLYLLGGLILLFTGFWAQNSSFDSIQKMRQMERVPNVSAHHVIPAEVSIWGKALKSEKLIKSRYTKTNCLYHRYLKKKEKRDSDGDTTWVTVESGERSVDFFLADDTGKVLVELSKGGIQPDLNEDYEKEEGRFRYTEWRIEEGEGVFAMAMGKREEGNLSLRFNLPGAYVPILSNDDGLGNRSGFGNRGILFSSIGVACLCFGCLFLCFVFRVHRVLVFLIFVSGATSSVMIYTGCSMLKHDLKEGYDRLAKLEDVCNREVEDLLGGEFKWETLPNEVRSLDSNTRTRALGIREDFLSSIERTNTIRHRFPENLLAPLWGIDPWPSRLLEGENIMVDAVIQETPISWWISIIWIGLALIFVFIGAQYGFKKIKTKRYIENIPTTSTAGLAYGPAEIKGKSEFISSNVLKGPLTGAACVYFRHKITEKRRSGKKTETVVIKDEQEFVEFSCRDSEGSIGIDPKGAEFSTQLKSKKRVGRQTHYEWHIAESSALYILGSAVIDKEKGDRLLMGEGDNDNFPFIISDETETEVMLNQSRSGLFGIGLAQNGFVCLVLAIFGSVGSFAASDFLFSALFSPLFLGFCMLALMFNDLVFLRNRVKRAWANIEVSLKKRADLIPNLEKITMGYLSHEQSVLDSVTKLRSALVNKVSYSPSEVDNAMKEESALTGRLLAIREEYPDLKANEMMEDFMNQLTRMENEVALMRSGYNDGIEHYRTVKRRIPEVFIAKAFKFEEFQLLRFSMEVHQIPSLNFSNSVEESISSTPSDTAKVVDSVVAKKDSDLEVYIHKDGQQFGPYTLKQIKSYVEAGNFTDSDQACWDGKNWKTIMQIPDFSK